MRVIHGVWAHGALCLWAEDPDLPPRSGPEAAIPSGMHLPRPHPFACQATELADLLAGSPPGSASAPAGDAVRKAVHDELTLQLPSAGGGPLASPELVRPEAPGTPGVPVASVPARRGRVSLASWRVPVLAIGPGAALEVLSVSEWSVSGFGASGFGTSGFGGSGLPDGAAIAGGPLTYLAAVASFAVGLTARGRVLPVLEADGEGYSARWRPVLAGADAQRARDLAAAMPPSCRAAAGTA